MLYDPPENMPQQILNAVDQIANDIKTLRSDVSNKLSKTDANRVYVSRNLMADQVYTKRQVDELIADLKAQISELSQK